MAARFGATIVPFGAVGAEDCFNQVCFVPAGGRERGGGSWPWPKRGHTSFPITAVQLQKNKRKEKLHRQRTLSTSIKEKEPHWLKDSDDKLTTKSRQP
eukprot:1160292-Pelagomonas_calceolata.AAC.7